MTPDQPPQAFTPHIGDHVAIFGFNPPPPNEWVVDWISDNRAFEGYALLENIESHLVRVAAFGELKPL